MHNIPIGSSDITLHAGRLEALEGPNFSGRTMLIQRAIRQSRDESGGGFTESHVVPDVVTTPLRRAYVGPEVYNALSGLAPTVAAEIALHRRGGGEVTGQEFATILDELIATSGLATLFDRNPFTLSGGEQACLAIACALALAPSAIGLDCALEQVDVQLKVRIIEIVRRALAAKPCLTAMILADNRLEECGNIGVPLQAGDFRSAVTTDYPFHFDPIDGDAGLGSVSQTPEPLHLQRVSYAYRRGEPVLRDVSVSLFPGTVYVLHGRNGAGKSTLAKLLCGCMRPSEGRFLLGDNQHRPWMAPGRLVAYHFQNPDIQLFSTSVAAEIAAGPRAQDSCGTRARDQMNAAARAFGLSHVLQAHPLDLPFVARKRVALAATLAMGCPWIVLDEPALSQDRSAAQQIALIARRLAESGIGVIVISHSPSFCAQLGAVDLHLHDGRLVHSASNFVGT